MFFYTFFCFMDSFVLSSCLSFVSLSYFSISRVFECQYIECPYDMTMAHSFDASLHQKSYSSFFKQIINHYNNISHSMAVSSAIFNTVFINKLKVRVSYICYE